MAETVLSLQELNRSTLARQMLLERERLPADAALTRLAGMQAQFPAMPFIGLWSRLQDFKRGELAELIAEHKVVRATMLRATLHLVTADDFTGQRPALQVVLDKSFDSTTKRMDCPGFDRQKVLAAAREFIAEQPRNFEDISAMLTERWPDCEVGAMRYAVRMLLPLIQVPDESPWCYPGKPRFALAEHWLKKPRRKVIDVRGLLHRYLAAFGPATISDFQTWSGLSGLKTVADSLKSGLRTYRDERKRELMDLPELEVTPGDTPAPVRFVPEYDNLLLAHTDRSRIIADRFHRDVFLSALRIRATFLVDGFVRGAWRVDTVKGNAQLVIEPFDTLTKRDRSALLDEAQSLVRFIEPQAKTCKVSFEDK